MCIITVPEVLQEWRWQSQSSGKECEQMDGASTPSHSSCANSFIVAMQLVGKQKVSHIPSILCLLSLILHILCLLKGVTFCLECAVQQHFSE
jgi:hypothetical protein